MQQLKDPNRFTVMKLTGKLATDGEGLMSMRYEVPGNPEMPCWIKAERLTMTPDYGQLGPLAMVGRMVPRPKFDKEHALQLKNFLAMKPKELVEKFQKFVDETPMFKAMHQPPELIYQDSKFRLVMPPFMSVHVDGMHKKPLTLPSFFEYLGIPTADRGSKPGLALFYDGQKPGVFVSDSDYSCSPVTSFQDGRPSTHDYDLELLEQYNEKQALKASERQQGYVPAPLSANVTLRFREHRAERSNTAAVVKGYVSDFLSPSRRSGVTRALNYMLRELVNDLNLPEKSLVAVDGQIQRGVRVNDSVEISLSSALADLIGASEPRMEFDLARKPTSNVNVINYSEDSTDQYAVARLFPLAAFTAGKSVNAYLHGYGHASLLGLWEHQDGTPSESPYVLLKEPSGQLELTVLNDRYERVIPKIDMEASLVVSVRGAR